MGSFQLKKSFVSLFISTDKAGEWTNTVNFYNDFKTPCLAATVVEGEAEMFDTLLG